MKFFFVLLFSFVTLVSYSQDFPVMLNLKSEVSVPDDFRDGVEESLTNLGYSLVDDKAQKEALKENAKSRDSECYDEECLVDTGKMLAARALISVEVDKKGDKAFKFKGKFIDFETGTTTKTKVMYYEASLADYKALSKFGKDFSNLLLGDKKLKTIKKVEPKKIETKKVEKKKEVKKKEVKKKVILKREGKKEVKKEKEIENLLLINPRHKGKWDITFALLGGSHSYFSEYEIKINDNFEDRTEFAFSAEGATNGGGIAFGFTYRFSNFFALYSNVSILISSGKLSGDRAVIGDTPVSRESFPEFDVDINSFWWSLGAQFSFGDKSGKGLVYYTRGGLALGNDTYNTNAFSTGDDTVKSMLDYETVVTLGVELELGLNILLSYNNSLDIYIAFYLGKHVGGGYSSSAYTSNNDYTSGHSIGLASGDTLNALIGVRYNLFTF